MAIQKHEYELSIWNEELKNDGTREEHKQQIIGAHDMTHLGRATNVHFKKLLNGTHIVTFQMPSKFFNSEIGDYVQNELAENIFNEQKIKLFFKDEWYEMVVKTISESKNFKSIMKNVTCSDGFIDELSRIGYDIILDPELNNSVNEINDFMEEIIDDNSTWSYKPEWNWGDFTEYREERFYKIPLSCFGGSIKAYKINLDAKVNKFITNPFTNEQRKLQLGDDLAGQEDYFWDQQDINRPLFDGDPITISGDYIYVPMSDLSMISPYLYNNLQAAAQTTEGYYREDCTKYALQPSSNNPNDIIQFLYFGDVENKTFHIDEANVLTDYNYTYILTIEDWEKYNIGEAKVYYKSDATPNEIEELNRDLNSLNSFMWKPVCYDGFLENIGQLQVNKARRINIANRSELNLYDDTFVTVYNDKPNDSDIFNLLEDKPTGYENYRIISKIDTRQILPILARNLISNGTKITHTTGWNSKIQKTENKDKTIVEDPIATLKIETIKDNKNNVKDYYLHYESTNKGDYLINFGLVGNEKIIEKNKVYALKLEARIYDPTEKTTPLFKINEIDDLKRIVIGKGQIDINGNYKIVNEISFSGLSGNNINGYLLFKINTDIKNPYICFKSTDEKNNKTIFNNIDIKSFELFEAYTRGKDIKQRDDESNLSSLKYNYSGRDIVINKNFNEDGIAFSSIESKNLLLESDVTIGETYEIQNYYIQQKKNIVTNITKDTFGDKEKWYENGGDDSFNNTKYTDEDFEYNNFYFDLCKCTHLNNTGSECDYDENLLDICYYNKFGFCPYLFHTEKHPRRIRTLQQSKSNRFNLIQELSKVFEVYPTFTIKHDEQGKTLINNDNKLEKYVHFITEKGNEQLTGFRYEKNLSDISRTINSQNITTKLFVDPIDSEYYDTGYCTIQTARDNIGKNSYILDFSYYVKNNLLDGKKVEADLYGLEGEEGQGFLTQIDVLNSKYDILQRRISALTSEYYKTLKATNVTNIEGVLAALEEKQKVLQKMNRYKKKNQDNETYKKYQIEYDNLTAKFYGLIKDLFFTNGKCYNLYHINGQEQYFTPEVELNYAENDPWDEQKFWDNIITKDKKFEEGALVSRDRTWQDFREQVLDKNLYEKCGTIGQQTQIEIQIKDLKMQNNKVLKEIAKLSKKFNKKYENYLKEGTWTDQNYLTDNEYYWGGVSVLEDSSKPQIDYNINVINLLKADIKNNELYDIDLGDTTFVEDIDFFGVNNITGLPNKEKVLISEIDFDLDASQSDSIKVQNYTTQFNDLFQQITASVQSLTYNENVYKRAQSFTAKHYVQSDSLQGTLDQGNLTLLDATNSIKLDDNGTEGNAIQNTSSRYKLNGDGLFFSTDGGQSWINAVSPKGYNMDYAKIGSIDTGKIRLVDQDYVYFLWDSNGITAYRTPNEDDNKDIVLKNDFARFNKYGLSLVKDKKIRLRAGYQYVWKQGEVRGQIDEEEEIGEQNVGFYLYNEKGEVIFQTEVNTEEENDNTSARMSIKGEMFATGSNFTTIKNNYIYSKRHNLIQPIYFRKDNEVTDQQLISELDQQSSSTEEIYVIYDDDSKCIETNFIYYSNNYYIKQNNKYYVIIGVSQKLYFFDKEYDASAEVEISTKIESRKYTYFDTNGDKQVDIKLYPVGTFYFEDRKEIPISENETSGIYINNKDISDATSSNSSLSNSSSANDLPRRLICMAKKETGNVSTNNIFSVLENGELYIGGEIQDKDSHSGFDANAIPDRIKILNSQISLRKDEESGEIQAYFGEENLKDEINRRIDYIASLVASAGVPPHKHNLNIPSLKLECTNQHKTAITTLKFDVHNQKIEKNSEEEIINPMSQEPYIALTNTPYHKQQMGSEVVSEFGLLSWVKLSEFLELLRTQNISTSTEMSASVGGGGGEINPTTYGRERIVQIAKQVVNAHYQNMVSLRPSQYYSNYSYLDTTINDHTIKSRRDCSGLINGIWQALGDMTAANSYTLNTHSYVNSHPRNWTLIRITGEDMHLEIGDVLFRVGATKGFDDGHTEIISEIRSPYNELRTYSLGSDSGLENSFNNNNSTYKITNYDYILRREVDPYVIPQNQGAISLDRTYYANHKSSDDNQSAVNFYFSGQISDNFMGLYPTTVEEYNSDACKGLRCIVQLCNHEFGSWPFAAASYAKLVRAFLIGGTYSSSLDYGANNRKSSNLYEWMWNLTHNTQGIFGDWSINNGEGARNAPLAYVQAIYKNIKYPDLYGVELHTGTDTFKALIIKAASGIPTSNGGYWSLVQQAKFIVDYKNDNDYDETPVQRNTYLGRYIMYRTPNSFTVYNTNIQ